MTSKRCKNLKSGVLFQSTSSASDYSEIEEKLVKRLTDGARLVLVGAVVATAAATATELTELSAEALESLLPERVVFFTAVTCGGTGGTIIIKGSQQQNALKNQTEWNYIYKALCISHQPCSQREPRLLSEIAVKSRIPLKVRYENSLKYPASTSDI
uniref:Uncharacterized protein n=1 Tax=Glossina austeni TaxID=7395 RepID=A0A1A9UF99_GLOAU